ncbi:hypothetical protein ACU8KH_06587 [Lachancea thermotolerans]
MTVIQDSVIGFASMGLSLGYQHEPDADVLTGSNSVDWLANFFLLPDTMISIAVRPTKYKSQNTDGATPPVNWI